MQPFRSLLPAAAAAAALIVCAPVAAQVPLATTAPPQNVVSLSASASMEVPKDQLTIVFSTTRDGPDAAQVQSQLKQALEAALAEARKAARPGQLDVQTGNFSLYPRHTAKGPSGWTGSAELVVEGKDMVAVSQLAGRIQTLTIARTAFGLSREAREQVDAEVTAQAIARFKARAAEVARQFGFGGWALREVTVQGVDVPPMQPMPRIAMAAASPMGEALPVEAGKATVSATVSGSVQLSPR
jgi:predicted secreted protein